MHTIFVYGTLKQGGRWHHLLSSAKLLTLHDAINGALYLHPDLYPMLFSGNKKISGETYVVSEEQYKKIVALEFEYEKRTVTTEAGHVAEVFFYKDIQMKKKALHIEAFDAAAYFKKWLAITPKDSSSYQLFLRWGGKPQQ